jgi:hypothetical protein
MFIKNHYVFQSRYSSSDDTLLESVLLMCLYFSA